MWSASSTTSTLTCNSRRRTRTSSRAPGITSTSMVLGRMDSSSAVDARPAVVFEYAGRFGHFLRAEASVSALSYPVPPRTALLGMIGAVLGLEKDAPQVELADAMIAVSGPIPRTHWHKVKLRKKLPEPLPLRVKKGDKGRSAAEKATLIRQE